MNRCGNCPIAECAKFGVCCPGGLGAEECANKLQNLYREVSQRIESNKAKVGEPEIQSNDTPLPAKRAVTLINALIDHMINDAGGHAREVLSVLLDIGFDPKELVQEFQFTQSDVDECLDEIEEESDDE